MFALTYLTQLHSYTTCPHQGHLSDICLVLNTATEPRGQNNIRARVHEWFFFAAAVKQPRWLIISWLCARTVKETLRSHIFLTIWCRQYVRYKSTRHLLCHNLFYDHTLAEI